MYTLPGSKSSNNFPTKLVVIGVAIAAILGAVSYLIFFSPTSNAQTKDSNKSTVQQASIQPAIETIELNRTFEFPLFDEADPEAPPLSFEVLSAEKRDEIIVQGKRANTIEGRTFFIVNLKINNPHTAGIEVNSRNFFRLSTNDGQEWLAPDIHNDPVKVQAISTKPTRIGFPINDSDRLLLLQVGEIQGEKQVVEIELTK